MLHPTRQGSARSKNYNQLHDLFFLLQTAQVRVPTVQVPGDVYLALRGLCT